MNIGNVYIQVTFHRKFFFTNWIFVWLVHIHSVLERIWVKGSYTILPQGERGPPKESKSQ